MRTILALVLPLALTAAAPAALAQSDFVVEGKYELVQPVQPTETADKVEVVDVFWYGCPHCFRFLPVMEAYIASKPEYVEVRHMPAIFRSSWEAHARAYYVAETLGVAEAIHRPLFEEIHVKGRKMDDRESLAKFFEGYGVTRADFDATWDSFAVDANVRKSMVMQERYGIRGTPSVVVAGKYRTSGALAGSYENVLKVVAALVDKEHQAQLASR